MAKIVIIDSNNLIYRSFHGVKTLQTSTGIPTNALYGCLKTFKKVIEKLEPNYIIACWDSGKKSFRNTIDASYKAHRPPIDSNLKKQFPIVQEAFRHLGIPQITAPDSFEGDDVIASLAVAFSNVGHDVIILSADRDFFQLFNDKIKMISFNNLDVILDEKYIMDKYGVKPSNLIHIKALEGEKSDNIEGIAGIGAKTAIALIKEHQTLENLLAHLKKNPKHKHYHIYEKKELALKCLELARINANIDIEPPPILPVHKIEINSENLMNFFNMYELKEMKNNFNSWYYMYNYLNSTVVRS